MASPSEEAATRIFVGCRYTLGTDKGTVERCRIQKGVYKLYRPNETVPFFTFHHEGMWWTNGDSITVFKPGSGVDTIHLHGIRE